MRRLLRLVLPGLLALGLLAATAGATHNADRHFRMTEEFTSGNQATNSDLAFWGDHAFVGYYTGAAGFPPGTGSRGGRHGAVRTRRRRDIGLHRRGRSPALRGLRPGGPNA